MLNQWMGFRKPDDSSGLAEAVVVRGLLEQYLLGKLSCMLGIDA